jgi:hypothetical protein
MAEKRSAQKSEIAELYRQPLEAFTAARNALAARLRGAGRQTDALAVKALVKPSLSAWAVNQLFHREGERMKALLDAGRQARSAQRDAVAGRGAEAFREALAAARKLAEELRQSAVARLAASGKAPGAGIVERIATDLAALAFSPAAAEAATRGYLDADLDPPGFEVLAGLQLAGASRKPPRQAPPARAPRSEREPPERPQPAPRLLHFKPAQKETAAAAATRRREEAEAARTARAAAKQRERVERAEAVVQQAAEKAKTRRAEAAEATREATAARRQAAEAERAATAAERRVEAALAELARARESLAEVRADSK